MQIFLPNIYQLLKSRPCRISLHYLCMPWPGHLENWYGPTGSEPSVLKTPAVPDLPMCCDIPSVSWHTSWKVTDAGVWSKSPSYCPPLRSSFVPFQPHHDNACLITALPGYHHDTSQSTHRHMCLVSGIWGTCGIQFCPSCIPCQLKGVQSYGSALYWNCKFHIWYW